MAISSEKVRLTTIIEKETAQAIEMLAKEENRTLSAMAVILLKKAVSEYKK